jgi:3-oxoacyl-[acyl-carrier-protein] synthase II
MKKRVGVFGWGIVAPRSPNVAAFRNNLTTAESWLTPFEGFGPNNFLVGQPDFNFNDYRNWIDSRFAPRHFQNLKEKVDTPSLAIGAFIQALDQNPGLDTLLHELGNETHVFSAPVWAQSILFIKQHRAIGSAEPLECGLGAAGA